MMNGAPLRWKVAQVEGGYYDDEGNYVLPPYYSGGKVQGWTRQQCDKALEEAYYAEYPFEFVYYFTAHFNEGLNIVEHTYTYDLSMSVEEEFSFYYILTAACRWAGGQIDDFTLRINMGQPDSFFILPTFYDDILEWKIEGAGKTSPYEPPYRYEGEDEKPISMVHLREGWISFHKKNFCPEGELSVSKPLSGMPWIEELRGDSMFEIIREQYPDWSLWAFEDKESFLTPEEKRILKNLPFACHGYVFKTPALQRFFESTAWYIPDPSYRADMKLLSKEEQEWVNYWSK